MVLTDPSVCRWYVIPRPILWHIEISHYNEKARWALDLKGVDHERRALIPGYHVAVALALTHGHCYTSPILELEVSPRDETLASRAIGLGES